MGGSKRALEHMDDMVNAAKCVGIKAVCAVNARRTA